MKKQIENIVSSKINGTLLGVVVGDLLGEQVEGILNPGIIKKFRKGAKYTDDTEMTLITLQHLLTFKTIDSLTITLEYAANADYSRKYGGNAYKTLKKIKTNPELWETAYTEFLENGSWGNGCLMRISPIALFDVDSPLEILSQHLNDCLKGTHNNEEALQCSIEYCLTLKDLLHKTETDVNFQSLTENIINRNLNQRLTSKIQLIKTKIVDTDDVCKYDLLFQFINDELVENKIRASDTLSLVIAILVYNFKYKQWSPTQLMSIIVSMGGDTDTNCAILGSFLGALYGINWIDIDWFNNIENKNEILDQFKKFTDYLIQDKKLVDIFNVGESL